MWARDYEGEWARAVRLVGVFVGVLLAIAFALDMLGNWRGEG